MKFRLLGPFEVSEGSDPVPLGGPRQRAVLAHLLVRANRVVATDDLVDALWGEELPDLPRASVHTYISNLRKSLGADCIESRAPGYVLRVEPDEVDALRFEALVREGRRALATDPERAAATFDEALGLWRGRPFADLAREPSLGGEVTRLEELRLSAIEGRMDSRLALGGHTDLVGELEVLVREHPLRERFWGQLMLALYRSGRQGEALAAFHRAREILADELGVDPSPDLQRLHEQILRQDPGLELVGRPLRGYRLVEQIGEGAFGTVYQALQPELGREIAVKVIHERLASDPQFVRRFEREAQLVARLEHPHIVPLYDYWRDPDGAYLAMRYLRGGNLAHLLEEGRPLSAEAAVRLVDQIAAALGTAHRQGVVHRDVRPPNILFDEEGNAYLSDFGIAKEVAAADRAETIFSGLAYYLSPEEILGEPVTPATDVYSLGLVLYELLAGRHPYADSSASEVLDRHLSGAVPSIAAVRSGLSPSVDEVIQRATARESQARYENASALASAFRSALQAPALSAPLLGVEIRNPYKGLRPFDEPDASDFFGREALTAELVARLGEPSDGARFLAVVGPSGSGKSSVVRAGLIPALRAGAVLGSERWFVVEMHPGAHPFDELGTALLSIAARRTQGLVEQLERDEHGLVSAVEGVLPQDGSELLLLIDQFEELFTLVDDAGRRTAFLESIRTAIEDPRSRVRVVATLRADFYDRPLLYKAFGDLLAARTQVVTPLSAEDLQRAIVGPAERVGMMLEPRLVAEVLTEVSDQPAALPLLQYALTELFEHRDDSTITLEAYHEIGGVLGALGRRAEEIYGRLDQRGKEAARQLFLRLVTLGDEGAAETRRRVLRSELTSLELAGPSAERAVDLFGAYRLLSFDRDPVTRGPTVEVAHEALLREWERLRGWIESAREDVIMHRRLAAAAAEWESAGRDPSFLLLGGRLDQFEAWAATSSFALTGAERGYLTASTAQRDAERAEEEGRRAREAALERRSRIRLRALVALISVAALVASGLTLVARSQRQQAREQARIAMARELAAAAVANLNVDPQLSLLLALEAVRTTRSADGTVLREAEDVLHRAVLASRIVATMPGAGTIADWSDKGGLLAFAGGEDGGTVEIRDATTAGPLRSWKAHASIEGIAFTEDGSILATSGDDGTIKLWDPSTARLVRTLDGGAGEVWGLEFSSDGRFLAGLWWGGGSSTAIIWDVTSGLRLREIRGLARPDGGPAYAAAFSPAETLLAVGRWEAQTEIYDLATGRRVRTLLPPGEIFSVNDVEWSPDGERLATAGQTLALRLWDPDSGKVVDSLFGHSAAVNDMEWSRDGSRLVTAGQDGTAKVWEIGPEGGRLLLTLAGHGVVLTGATFSPDGTRILTTDVNGTAKIWDVGVSGDAEWLNLHGEDQWFGDVTFSPDGRRLLGSFPGSTVRTWDAATGKDLLTLRGHKQPNPSGEGVAGIAVSPGGRLIATAGRDQTVRVWEAATGRGVFTFGGHTGWVEEAQFSPDGALLATASWDRTARIIDVSSGLEVRSLPHEGEVSSAQFTSDGRLLVTGSWDGSVRVWDSRNGALLRRIQAGSPVNGVAVDPDGTRVAVATRGGTAGVWDVRSGKQISTQAGHSAPVIAVAFSPDSSRVATASEDGDVRRWDPDSGVTTLVLPGHSAPVGAVAFSPDGSRLASIGNDMIRIWALDLDDLLELAEGELTRSLTDEECRQYLHVAPCPSRAPLE